MNEIERLYLLDAMGIESFFPRALLPLMPKAMQVHLPEGALAKPQSSEAAQQSTGSGSLLEQWRQAGGSPPRESSPKLVPTQIQNRDAEANSSNREVSPPVALKFSISLWLIDNRIQVMDSRDGAEALPVETLLQNILLANHLLDLAMPKTSVLSWPPSKAKITDSGWSGARNMLRDFFAGRMLAHPIEHFILCGAEACRAMLGEDFNLDAALYSLVQVPELQRDALILPSLQFFLRNPQEKRHLWKAFQALRHAKT